MSEFVQDKYQNPLKNLQNKQKTEMPYLIAENRFLPCDLIKQPSLAELLATNTGISMGSSLKNKFAFFGLIFF